MFSLTGDSLFLIKADYWGALEPVTPWIEKDTARHYQFYPFVNMAHPSIASSGSRYAQKYQAFMKKGLNILDQRRESNPFRVTIPFIWCSNNYVTASIVQHRLYREISGSDRFIMSEAALRDWLFGCNPLGTSMICGLPAGGDFPVSPHAAITLHLNKVPEGGLIDGPVYSSIYKNLIGIRLLKPDEYNDFQYGRAVYHDDIGDYSTNEPTMDGTACISLVLSSLEADGKRQGSETKGEVKDSEGAIIRTDKSEKKIHLIFSADEYGEGFEHILNVLSEHSIKASFFLTGNFLRNNKFRDVISRLKKEDHYIGPHSDRHLLYASWNDRDSLMITKAEFQSDLKANYRELEKIGIELPAKRYFLPPYEWYNSSITSWSSDMGVDIINFTPGTGTNADYTTPDMKNYRTSNELLNNLKKFEEKEASGLNGAFILIHPGTEAARTDKLYLKLDEIIEYFSGKGYTFNKL
jgi:peptidoglycan/xylan/chitin deacetylase (PgdA/CDA1 family)